MNKQTKKRGTRMAKKTPMKQEHIEVIVVSDHHDERCFLETITNIAETGTAHVRYLGSMAEELENTFAVSNLPLSTKRAVKAVHENQIEWARNDLPISKDPYEVMECYCLSVADIDRIAEEEGLTLPHDWFQVGQKETEDACANASRAEVERLEGLLAKAKNDMASVQVPAQAK